MAVAMIDRTIDMLLRNLRNEVRRLETELKCAQNENEGLRLQLKNEKERRKDAEKE